MNGKILLFSIILAISPSVWSFELRHKIDSIFKNNQTVRFELNSNEMSKLLKEKLGVEYNLKANVKVRNNKITINFEDKKHPMEIMRIVEKSYSNKIKLLFPTISLAKKYKDFKLKKNKSKWKIYEDESKLNPFSEVWFKENKLNIQIIEISPAGRRKTTIEKKSFSNDKRYITRVNKVTYEGAQKLDITTSFKYKKTDKNTWIPLEIRVKTKQNLTIAAQSDVSRELFESFKFTDVKVEK